MSAITYTLVCDRCGMAWSTQSPFDFTIRTEQHREKCEGLPGDAA